MFFSADDNTPYQRLQDQRARLRYVTSNRPRRPAKRAVALSVSSELEIQHNKAIKSGRRQQYKRLPITLTQC